MENEFLKPALDTEICHQIRDATNSTPRYVVLGRVVETVCNYINLPLNSLPDYKNTIRLDAESKRAFEEYWNSQGNQTNNDPIEELEKIVSRDYHKPSDMIRFVGVLLKRESKHMNANVKQLYEILAVDGYLGEDVKRYVDYLKLASWDPVKALHVHAVRQLYRDNHVQTPSEMHRVLDMALGFKPCEQSEDVEVANIYKSLVGDALESIREWKMHQSQEKLKRKESGGAGGGGGAGRKRKMEKNDVEGSTNATTPPKRIRKNKTPVKIEIPVDPNTLIEDKNEDSSSSSSEDELEPVEE